MALGPIPNNITVSAGGSIAIAYGGVSTETYTSLSPVARLASSSTTAPYQAADGPLSLRSINQTVANHDNFQVDAGGQSYNVTSVSVKDHTVVLSVSRRSLPPSVEATLQTLHHPDAFAPLESTRRRYCCTLRLGADSHRPFSL
jgi:hypothetical protein